MKVLLVVSAVIVLGVAQRPNLDDGRYYPTDDGQYRPDNSGAYHGDNGAYHPDNSGAYNPDDSGAYRGTYEKYVHTADKFGGGGSGDSGAGGSGGAGLGGGTGGVFIGGVRRPVVVTVQPVGTIGTGVTLKHGSAAGLYDNRNYAIIRKEENVGLDGYHYLYETENKILGEEQGKLANVGTDKEAIQASGYYEYTGPDNVVYRVDYTANEDGFVPSGAHIPTPPPIPQAILRSLEYQRSIGKL